MKRTGREEVSKETYRKIGLLVLVVCLYLICAPLTYLEANQRKNVLVLHSYHQGLGWTDGITQGIESSLRRTDQEIELFFEYMDTKRIHDAQHFQNLYELYRHKYRNRRFDVIISSDDHAFNFLLPHHQELFPDTPIVFCGVNDFKDSMLVGHNLITGVVEAFDIKGTMDVAVQLHPNAKEVIVIVDKTLSGTIVKELMMKDIPYFKDVLRFTFLEDLDMSEVLERVKNLPTDSIVFLISLLIDKSGNTFSFEKSCALISQNSSVPIYSHSDVYLGHGLVGGMLNCGDAQGQMAGEMASRILHGEKVKDIPVVKESPKRYKFDYEQMQRFGIKLSSLPEGSIVINKPYSFYSKYKRLVWSLIAGLAGLVLIILILSINIINRRRVEMTLRESEATARALLNTPTDAMALIDTRGIILDANETMACRLGKSVNELIGLFGWDLIPPELAQSRKAFADKVIQSGKSVRFEDERQGMYYDNVFYPVFDAQGKTTKIAVMARDLTEHKKVEEEIREIKESYDRIMDNADEVIFRVDAKGGHVLYANPVAERLVGYSLAEWLDDPTLALKIIHPDFKEKQKQIIEEINTTKKTIKNTVLGWIAKDGREIIVEYTVIPIVDKEDKIIYFESIGRDITERKWVEEALRESEEKYRTILENIEDGYFEVDIAGNFTFFNDSLCKILGYSKDELMGMNNRQYTDEENAKEVYSTFNKVYTTGKPDKSFDWEIIRKDGGKRYVEASVSLRKDPEDQPRSIALWWSLPKIPYTW